MSITENLPPESMPEFNPVREDKFLRQDVKVLCKYGMHLRPSGKFYEKFLMPNLGRLELFFKINAEGYSSDFVGIGSALDLMGLACPLGTVITVRLAYTPDGREEEEESNMEDRLIREIYDFFASAFEDGETDD